MNRPLPRRIATQLIATLALCAGGGLACRADITLPSVISDNMVLQQHVGVRVWGKADPGESVTVKLGPDIGQTTAGQDGNWELKLAGIKSGGPYDMEVSGKNILRVQNIAIGEVWVCAGESNMEYKVVAAQNGPEEMADADLPMLRVFVEKHRASDRPQADCEGSWVVCDPDTVKDLSAVGFFFGRELNRGMRTPVGLIQSAWGPSPLRAWVPRETLQKDARLQPVLDAYDNAVKAFPDASADYQNKLTDWKTAADAARTVGGPVPPKPVPPLEPSGRREPGALYNGMIAPLVKFPIRGVLWYQGETDTGDAALYREMLPAMIGAWRAAWGDAELPFFYAQLSGFLSRRAQPEESRWAELREAQAETLATPHTGMAVTIDTAEENNMHPADKQDVGHRLALLAESQVYGKGVTASGPIFSGMSLGDGRAVISFEHTDGGLMGRRGAAMKGFEVAGADRVFHWGDAQILGDKVVVHSKDVPEPVAVRYAWADMPDADLMSREKLPAAPFRTDRWVVGQEDMAPTAASPSPKAAAKKRKHAADTAN